MVLNIWQQDDMFCII